jgi:uncharacterized spore protein YtfJ
MRGFRALVGEDGGMEATELLAKVRDSITVKQVFGEPIERDGATILPVARVHGGAGGGGGGKEERRGDGAGFGLSVRPAGVFVISDGKVSWQPAVNVNLIVLGGQVAGIVLILVIRSIVRLSVRGRNR